MTSPDSIQQGQTDERFIREIGNQIQGKMREERETPSAKTCVCYGLLPCDRAHLVYALNQMSVDGYRYIPLLDDQGHPTRVVSERGIVEALATLFAQDIFNLPPAPPLGVPQDREGA